MPIISYTDTKSPKGRLVVLGIYLALVLGGLTMVLPFLVMVTGSVSTPFDYERRSVLPRFLWSREDRLLRTLCTFFPPTHRASLRQLRAYFPDLPEEWQLWSQIGDDRARADAWARRQLQRLEDPQRRAAIEAAARDYRDFAAHWNLRETILAYDSRHIAPFLRARYGTLQRFNQTWEMAVDDFSQVRAAEWAGEPIDQPGYFPVHDVRYEDLLDFRQAYREHRFTPFLKGDGVYAGYLRPAALRFLWEDYAAATLATPASSSRAPHPQSEIRNPKSAMLPLPFPVPADADPRLRALWHRFLLDAFPLRHIGIRVDAARQAQFRRFLQARFRNLSYMSRVLEQPVRSWDALPLTPAVPEGPSAKVWMDFVRLHVPVAEWTIRETLPELAFQRFALKRHGSLAAINQAYGLKLARLEQLHIPFGEAVLLTFANREWGFTFDQMTGSYRTVIDYLFRRGRAVSNTVILVGLSILITLTVNPLAGYALSRFRLRATERIIVFCLATMAFPSAVAAIPGFLLLRDLSLLNTFAALVLPGAAHGMTIFLLKGFFDSLPRELYEAATIDGAPEWQIFTHISIPLVKPILAVSMLNAFIAAYNGWEWAIIVCQDRSMWTIAVWTYQFYQSFAGAPYAVMAAFIVNSIPMLVVFLFCQKVILRGIILPQMK
ncbi:MAG: carbohydrate ABC transporter permease [Armatimonadetes bacterium]|nr:carbohydrate ABC transporter permease [Armatimonadota bacterium]